MTSGPASPASRPWRTPWWTPPRPERRHARRRGAGLSVRLDVTENPTGPDAEPVPSVRARISKRIV